MRIDCDGTQSFIVAPTVYCTFQIDSMTLSTSIQNQYGIFSLVWIEHFWEIDTIGFDEVLCSLHVPFRFVFSLVIIIVILSEMSVSMLCN